MNLATSLGGRYKPVPVMAERENAELIADKEMSMDDRGLCASKTTGLFEKPLSGRSVLIVRETLIFHQVESLVRRRKRDNEWLRKALIFQLRASPRRRSALVERPAWGRTTPMCGSANVGANRSGSRGLDHGIARSAVI